MEAASEADKGSIEKSQRQESQIETEQTLMAGSQQGGPMKPKELDQLDQLDQPEQSEQPNNATKADRDEDSADQQLTVPESTPSAPEDLGISSRPGPGQPPTQKSGIDIDWTAEEREPGELPALDPDAEPISTDARTAIFESGVESPEQVPGLFANMKSNC